MVLPRDQLFTLYPPPGTRLTLRPSESTLALPIVGAKEALVKAGLAQPRRN